jgi:hypothetical protein
MRKLQVVILMSIITFFFGLCFYLTFREFVIWGVSVRGKTLPFPRTGPLIFRLDDSFNETEEELIKEALEELNRNYPCARLNYYKDNIPFSEMVSWKTDNTPTIYKASNKFSWKHLAGQLIASDEIVDYLAGVTMSSYGDVFIFLKVKPSSKDLKKHNFKAVIIHEIIHVLFNDGWHSQDRKSLMYDTILNSGDQELQREEKEMLKDLCWIAEMRK